jgi:hypothetical protein
MRHLPPWMRRCSALSGASWGRKSYSSASTNTVGVYASVTFLKALLLHCCSPSPTTLLELMRLRRCPWCSAMPPVAGEALNCACCAFMRSIAVGCPATLDLADVVSSGCFAAISWADALPPVAFWPPLW